MTYFGIKNLKSDVDAAVINWSSHSNILNPEIEPHWEELLEEGGYEGGAVSLPREKFQEYDQTQNFVSSKNFKPLLYSQRQHLKPLWKDFKNKSFITNRRTLELFSFPAWEIEFELMVKEMTIEKEKRIFYIFYDDKFKKYEEPVGSDYVIQRTSDIGYTQYYCKTKNYNGFDFHYTSKIDAFHAPSGEPIATKHSGCYFPIDPDLAWTAAFQCYLADIDKLLCSQRSEDKVHVQIMSVNDLKELDECAGSGFMGVDGRIHSLEEQIKQLTDFVNENGPSLIGKTVKCKNKAWSKMVFSVN